MKFYRFFLDQVDYMNNLLQLNGLVEWVRSYVQMRGTPIIANPPGGNNQRPEAARML